MNQQDEVVKNYQALKKKHKSEEALTLLKRLASQVKPILTKRNWVIKNLCEFFPTNPSLLGVNVNKGWKINLRLRPHFDDTQFLEYDDILGTLLHEMAHIVRGPHDEIFYKLLEELKLETEVLMAKGYTGEGFYSDGHHLGSRSVPQYLSKQAALAAAEKRKQLSNIMLPAGGVKLGGSSSPLLKNMTPTQRAAYAAQKRLRDKIWCGGSIENENDSANSSTVSSPAASSSTSVKRKYPLDHNNDAAVKKTIVTIDLTEEEGWTCATCTFINKPLLLACEVCLTERLLTKQDNIPHDSDSWTCPQCTLLNEKKWQTCTACTYVNLQ